MKKQNKLVKENIHNIVTCWVNDGVIANIVTGMTVLCSAVYSIFLGTLNAPKEHRACVFCSIRTNSGWEPAGDYAGRSAPSGR